MGNAQTKKKENDPRARQTSILNPNQPFLLKYVLSDILHEPTEIVCVKPEDTLKEVMEVFKKCKISSAPVIGDKMKILGTIGCLDIALFTVATSPNLVKADNYVDVSSHDLPLVSVAKIMEFSKKDPFVALTTQETMAETLNLFQTGVHRAVVFDSESQMFGVFSQTDALKFLYSVLTDHAEPLLNAWCSRSITELGFKAHPVSKIDVEECVSDAVEQMIKGRTHNIALLKESELVGSFRAGDLRYLELGPTYLQELNLSVREFLCKHKPCALEPLTVLHDDSLETVMEKLVTHSTHHLYVLKLVPDTPLVKNRHGDRRPPSVHFRNDVCGVITITDVLRMGCGATQLRKPTQEGSHHKNIDSPKIESPASPQRHLDVPSH